MKDIIYSFNNRGCYLSDKTAVFETETYLRLIIEPHNFELKVSEDVLRKSSCAGYIIEVSRKGEVHFCDYNENPVASSDETQKEFEQVKFLWKREQLCLEFGRIVTVDYYPNCDGEYDRWGKEWVTQHTVTLNLKDNSVEVK